MPCARDMRNLTTGTDSARAWDPAVNRTALVASSPWSRAGAGPRWRRLARRGRRGCSSVAAWGTAGSTYCTCSVDTDARWLAYARLGDLTCVSQCVRARRRRLARERRPTAHVVYWCGEPYDRRIAATQDRTNVCRCPPCALSPNWLLEIQSAHQAAARRVPSSLVRMLESIHRW
jgi:hypothetical protein